MRVFLCDTIRLDPDQPEQLDLGTFSHVRFAGRALYADETLIARHEEGLGWVVAGEHPRHHYPDGDPRSFIYSDLTIE